VCACKSECARARTVSDTKLTLISSGAFFIYIAK